jgi:hypothetical protein
MHAPGVATLNGSPVPGLGPDLRHDRSGLGPLTTSDLPVRSEHVSGTWSSLLGLLVLCYSLGLKV